MRKGIEISERESHGLTRREALKRGTLAGLGLVWATPTIERVSLGAQFAQNPSPIERDTPGTTASEEPPPTVIDEEEEQEPTDSTVANDEESKDTQPTETTETTETTEATETTEEEVVVVDDEVEEEDGREEGEEEEDGDQVEDEVLDTVLEPDEPEDAVSDTEAEIEDEVLDTEVAAEELPLTGLHAEHLIPLAGGLMATGALAVRLARERREGGSAGDSTPEPGGS